MSAKLRIYTSIQHKKEFILKKLIIVLVVTYAILIAFTSPVHAKENNSAKKSTETIDKIDRYLKSNFKNSHFPGAAIIIVDCDSILYSNTYGACESIDTPFVIGSMTKSFTALAVMQLSEQGVIELDKPVNEYLPYTMLDRSVTVRHLLNQTSGLSTYQTKDDLKVNTIGTHEYSNINYGLLGEIIEETTGLDYNEYVDRHIFQPIGMNHSGTTLEKGKTNGLIDGYQTYFGMRMKQEILYPDSDTDYWISVPAGYINSSVTDMAKYLQMYLNKGNTIISEKSLDEMLYNVVPITQTESYGYGWRLVDNYSEPLLYHAGLTENYTSYMCILPESEIGIVLLFNMNDYFVGNGIAEQLNNEITLHFFEEDTTDINKYNYWFFHLLINAVYILLLIIAVLPLIFLKKWNSIRKDKKLYKVIISVTTMHIIYPTLLLLAPTILNIPFFAVKAFVPDLYITLVTSAIIAYIGGLSKTFLLVSNRYEKRNKI